MTSWGFTTSSGRAHRTLAFGQSPPSSASPPVFHTRRLQWGQHPCARLWFLLWDHGPPEEYGCRVRAFRLCNKLPGFVHTLSNLMQQGSCGPVSWGVGAWPRPKPQRVFGLWLWRRGKGDLRVVYVRYWPSLDAHILVPVGTVLLEQLMLVGSGGVVVVVNTRKQDTTPSSSCFPGRLLGWGGEGGASSLWFHLTSSWLYDCTPYLTRPPTPKLLSGTL